MEKLIKTRSWILKLTIGLGVFVPLYFMAAALGTKFGLWGWKFGFGKLMVGYGPKLLMLALVLPLISLILALVLKPRGGWLVALLCMIIPVAAMGYGKKMRATAKSLPFIHDITTDTQDPPQFTDVIIKARGTDSNSLDYMGKTVRGKDVLVSAAQVKAYPDIRTLVFSQDESILYERALKAVKAMGLELASSNKDTGIIEATYSSTWFGFKDDMVIRIRPSEGGGSVVDVRSISRVGGSDVGKNAARIRAFRDQLGG